jgi:hypothetical protein
LRDTSRLSGVRLDLLWHDARRPGSLC